MSTQADAAVARLARWLLGCAVRHWPAESRPWGLALAAEIDETTSAREALRWSLGGLAVFARSALSGVWTWLKLPAGGSLPSSARGPGEASLLPKRSRAFTAAIVGVAAILLFLPGGREAIRTVSASWQGYQQSAWDARTLEKLAARAEKERDARTLAFVALGTEDPKRAAALTELAIAMNPELIWVYGARNRWPNYEPLREQWLARLQAADPGNAVPDLLAADALMQRRVGRPFGGGATEDTLIKTFGSDSEWVALMERAFRAPRYDSYFQNHYQLTRMVWSREEYLSPAVVLYPLSSHAFPDLLNIRIYSEVKVQQAQSARAAGDLERAESLLGEVDAFGMRMADSDEPKLEKLIGMAVANLADRELADIYSTTGNTKDARRVTLRLGQLEQRVKVMAPGHDQAVRQEAFRREATLVQGFGILAAITGIVAFAGILLLELWPRRSRNAKTIWRRASCWAADYAPAMLLAASGAFLLSFWPFQHAFAEYRASNYLLAVRNPMDALLSLNQIPDWMLSDYGHVTIWSAVTIALTALLIFLVARGVYRTIES